VTENNIDKKCAKYGFEICDHAKVIYDILNEKLKELQEKNPINLVKIAKEIYKDVIDNLSREQDVKDFERYVRIDVLEKLEQDAKRIQRKNISDKEKIKEFSRERKFSTFARKCESSIRKTLGILSSDGVFAAMVWIESNEKEDHYRAIKYQISKFLHEILGDNGFSGDPRKLMEETLNACSDISQMFFIKQTLERMLTYALYRMRSQRDLQR